VIYLKADLLHSQKMPPIILKVINLKHLISIQHIYSTTNHIKVNSTQ